MKKTFYFNTGVKPDASFKPYGKQRVRGTVQIPFDCSDVPDNAVFKFACDNPNLPGYDEPYYITREITNSDMVSKFAYFHVPESIP